MEELRHHRRDQDGVFSSLLNFFSAARRAEAEEREQDLTRNRVWRAAWSMLRKPNSMSSVRPVMISSRPIAALDAEVDASGGAPGGTRGCQIEAADHRIHGCLLAVFETLMICLLGWMGWRRSALTRAISSTVGRGSRGPERDRQLGDEPTDLEQALANCADGADSRTNDLGEAISRGFSVHGEQVETSVRVDASIRFEEERASSVAATPVASAQGHGSASVRYDLDTVRWVADDEIRDAVDRFRGWLRRPRRTDRERPW